MEPTVPSTLTIGRHGLHGFPLPGFGPRGLLRLRVPASVPFQEPRVSWRQPVLCAPGTAPESGGTHMPQRRFSLLRASLAVHKEKHPSSGQDPRPALPTHLPTPSVRLGSEGPGAPGNPSLLMVLDLLPTQAVHCFLAQGKRTVSECPPRPRNSKIFVILCEEVHLSSKGGVLEYLYTHI